MQILVATDFSTRSNRAVRQAGLLAQASNATLHVLHVVDDDQPESLVGLERREAESILAEQIVATPELMGVECRAIVAQGVPFSGILETAGSVGADLIVMGAHRRQILKDIFVGTTIERVMRTGPFPVLMVNNEAQRRYENVIAAVDMSDSSDHALRTAKALGLLGGSRTTVLHAFQPFAKGKMSLAGVKKVNIQEYAEREQQRAIGELNEFVDDPSLDSKNWILRADEGTAMEVIARAVADVRADLLILGTHGRTGLIKLLLGSVTEEAMRTLPVDILAAPPARN